MEQVIEILKWFDGMTQEMTFDTIGWDELKKRLCVELKDTLGGVLRLNDPKPWIDDEAPRIINDEKCWEICKALRNWLGVE